jgi:hypothetical protein
VVVRVVGERLLVIQGFISRRLEVCKLDSADGNRCNSSVAKMEIAITLIASCMNTDKLQ